LLKPTLDLQTEYWSMVSLSSTTVTLLACLAFQCLGLRRQPDEPPLPDFMQPRSNGNFCLQKDSLSDVIKSTLANLSFTLGRMECPPVAFVDPPRTRDDMGKLLHDRGLSGIGVQVGVQKDTLSSKALLGKWGRAALLIQVDTDSANNNDFTQRLASNMVCADAMDAKSLRRIGEVVQCKDFSTECAKLIPDGSVDFVYVNARKDGKGLLEDLQAYWPKVRVGGVIAGHGYVAQNEVGSSQQKSTKNSTKDETGQMVRGTVNGFFSGTLAEAPKDLKACPHQPVIAYREKASNTWIVAK